MRAVRIFFHTVLTKTRGLLSRKMHTLKPLTTLKMRIRAQWAALSPRKQLMILISSMIAALLSTYGLLWSPLRIELNQLRQQLLHEQKIGLALIQLNHHINQLQPHAPASSASVRHLRTKIQQSTLSKYLSQLNLIDQNSLFCRFEKVDFDRLIAWLLDFSQEENLTITKASIQKTNHGGAVDAEFVLQPGT